MKKLTYVFTLAMAMLCVPAAMAHPGHHENNWLHSFYTLDHLLVLGIIGAFGLTAGVGLMIFGSKAYAVQRRVIGASLATLSVAMVAYGVFA